MNFIEAVTMITSQCPSFMRRESQRVGSIVFYDVDAKVLVEMLQGDCKMFVASVDSILAADWEVVT